MFLGLTLLLLQSMITGLLIAYPIFRLAGNLRTPLDVTADDTDTESIDTDIEADGEADDGVDEESIDDQHDLLRSKAKRTASGRREEQSDVINDGGEADESVDDDDQHGSNDPDSFSSIARQLIDEVVPDRCTPNPSATSHQGDNEEQGEAAKLIDGLFDNLGSRQGLDVQVLRKEFVQVANELDRLDAKDLAKVAHHAIESFVIKSSSSVQPMVDKLTNYLNHKFVDENHIPA